MSNNINEIIFDDIYNYNVINTIQSVLNNLRNNNILNGVTHSASHSASHSSLHDSLNNSIQTFLFEDDEIEDSNETEYYELDITIYHDHDNDIFYENYFKSCSEINNHLGKSHKIKENDPIIGENCMICMEEYKNREFKRIIPKCQHFFHKKCIDKWLQRSATCPVCRCDLLNKTPQEGIDPNETNQISETINSDGSLEVESSSVENSVENSEENSVENSELNGSVPTNSMSDCEESFNS